MNSKVTVFDNIDSDEIWEYPIDHTDQGMSEKVPQNSPEDSSENISRPASDMSETYNSYIRGCAEKIKESTLRKTNSDHTQDSENSVQEIGI